MESAGNAATAAESSDNRLSSLLSRLSLVKLWERFEAALWQHTIEVYEIELPSVGGLISAHVDSTTACGWHVPQANGAMQHGHSKDHRPDLAQLKLMTVAGQPFGLLSTTQVLNGQRADDGLYLPIIGRTRLILGKRGVLYVGEAKMAALLTRATIAGDGDYYLTVAPQTGETAKQLPAWIEAALSGAQATVRLVNAAGQVIGCGYEFERQCTVPLPSRLV
jgi:transposase